jgi:hypothetical protein
MNYVNRRGDVYYLFQGVTKTGKPKYYVSLKAASNAGVRINSLPTDFELFESPIDSRVSIRKRIPSDIYENELQFVQERISAMVQNVLTRVVCEGRSIVIYESASPDEFKSMAAAFGGMTSRFVEVMQSSSPMSPAFRFKLIRKKERVFEAQRFCFRGGIEDWISLHHEGTLDELCQYYLKHLGKESFYELM